MALSVSAFPEHIQARHPNDVLSPPDDGNSRNVVTSPRILGFFGSAGSGVATKKPESHSSPRLGARDDEPDGLSSLGVTVPVSPTFQLSAQNERNMELGEQGGTAWTPRRHQPSPFARKTTPSPILSGSNRLEIGVATRTLPLPHDPSSHSLSSSRPLPILPNSTSDPFKAGLSSSPSSPGSLVPFKSASPIIIPSRSASGPSKHPTYPSSIPIPLRQPGRSRKASLPSTPSPISTPSSKVLITQQQRGHNPNTPSVSMRYQPLVVDLPSGDTSFPDNESGILAPSAIRPLPRVPPSCLNFGSSSSNSPNPTSPAPVPFKRPRTSPSSFSGFSGLSTSSFAVDPRSAFDNIPSSWASKPSGLSSSRPSSPPSRSTGILRTTTAIHPHRPPFLKLPRARSLSRTRRERSLDSYTSLSTGMHRMSPGSGGMTTPLAMSGGVTRSLTAGRFGYQGVRSLAKRPNVTPTIMGRQPQERRDSLGPGSASGKTSLTRGPSLRHVRPQCPSGPVVRTKSVRSTSAQASSPGRFVSSSSSQKPATPTVKSDLETLGLHVHPFVTSFGNDELNLAREESPIDSPLEFFVDGPETDVASVNRSPSPMKYARPPDNDELSDWHSTNDGETSDDDLGGVSSSTSNSRGFAVGRRRTQLRSYQMDYRPQVQQDRRGFEYRSSLPDPGDVTIQDLPRPARALPVPPKATSREKKKGKEENKKWSFGDFTSMSSLSSPSTPATRNSSPERKGRSRQPRRLAEAVSLALGSGNRDVTISDSRSGRGSGSGPSRPPPFAGLSSSYTGGIRQSGGGGGGGDVAAEYEVLDIRMPSLEGKDESRSPSPLDFRIPGFSSDNNSSDTPIFMKRSPASQDSTPRSESSRSDVHWVTKEGKQSGLRDPTVVESRLTFRKPLEEDYESEDTPFMWLSKDRPPAAAEEEGSLDHNRTLGSREMFPTVMSSISDVGYTPLPPLSSLLVYPKRGGKGEDVRIRKQRTSREQGRVGNLTGGGGSGSVGGSVGGSSSSSGGGTWSVSAIEAVANPVVDRKADDDDDDIYCDEEPGQVLEKESSSGWEETQVVDVIPKLKSAR